MEVSATVWSLPLIYAQPRLMHIRWSKQNQEAACQPMLLIYVHRCGLERLDLSRPLPEPLFMKNSGE